jgi:hypothetical protein
MGVCKAPVPGPRKRTVLTTFALVEEIGNASLWLLASKTQIRSTTWSLKEAEVRTTCTLIYGRAWELPAGGSDTSPIMLIWWMAK